MLIRVRNPPLSRSSPSATEHKLVLRTLTKQLHELQDCIFNTAPVSYLQFMHSTVQARVTPGMATHSVWLDRRDTARLRCRALPLLPPCKKHVLFDRVVLRPHGLSHVKLTYSSNSDAIPPREVVAPLVPEGVNDAAFREVDGHVAPGSAVAASSSMRWEDGQGVLEICPNRTPSPFVSWKDRQGKIRCLLNEHSLGPATVFCFEVPVHNVFKEQSHHSNRPTHAHGVCPLNTQFIPRQCASTRLAACLFNKCRYDVRFLRNNIVATSRVEYCSDGACATFTPCAARGGDWTQPCRTQTGSGHADGEVLHAHDILEFRGPIVDNLATKWKQGSRRCLPEYSICQQKLWGAESTGGISMSLEDFLTFAKPLIHPPAVPASVLRCVHLRVCPRLGVLCAKPPRPEECCYFAIVVGDNAPILYFEDLKLHEDRGVCAHLHAHVHPHWFVHLPKVDAIPTDPRGRPKSAALSLQSVPPHALERTHDKHDAILYSDMHALDALATFRTYLHLQPHRIGLGDVVVGAPRGPRLVRNRVTDQGVEQAYGSRPGERTPPEFVLILNSRNVCPVVLNCHLRQQAYTQLTSTAFENIQLDMALMRSTVGWVVSWTPTETRVFKVDAGASDRVAFDRYAKGDQRERVFLLRSCVRAPGPAGELGSFVDDPTYTDSVLDKEQNVHKRIMTMHGADGPLTETPDKWKPVPHTRGAMCMQYVCCANPRELLRTTVDAVVRSRGERPTHACPTRLCHQARGFLRHITLILGAPRIGDIRILSVVQGLLNRVDTGDGEGGGGGEDENDGGGEDENEVGGGAGEGAASGKVSDATKLAACMHQCALWGGVLRAIAIQPAHHVTLDVTLDVLSDLARAILVVLVGVYNKTCLERSKIEHPSLDTQLACGPVVKFQNPQLQQQLETLALLSR